MIEDQDKFLSLLKTQMTWPGPYTFKFVVPKGTLPQLTDHFPDDVIMTRPSKTGKYVSVTIEKTYAAPEEVVEKYLSLSQIEGLISL